MKQAALIVALAVVMVFGVVASTYAATETGTTIITASVNSRLVLTVPADHAFGAFNPDDANPAPYSGNVNVRSNVPFTLVRTNPVNTFPTNVLTVPAATGMDGSTQNKAPSAGGRNYAQVYTLDLPPGGDWADAGSFTSSYLYTATY